jgi:hypothetical protein
MKYDIFSFQQFRKQQDELNHLKHKLKSPMDDGVRSKLENDIDTKTKTVMQHLSKIQPGITEDIGAMGGSAGPTNVTGVATSTDPVSATAVRMKKKKSSILMTIRRKPVGT